MGHHDLLKDQVPLFDVLMGLVPRVLVQKLALVNNLRRHPLKLRDFYSVKWDLD